MLRWLGIGKTPHLVRVLRNFLSLLVARLVELRLLALPRLMLALFETVIAKMRVFRVSEFLGAALMLGLLGALLLFVSRGG